MSLNQWFKDKERAWEAQCVNCGACCGLFEDPCEHLVMSPEGKSACRIYPYRLGPQKSVAGEPFTCVNIRSKLNSSWPGDEHCGYKRV
ncbi:MAG: hypothetical protein HQL19_02335 [Candidatus Omnitrophica bacterium]|nr:hypothetical protein [Candidatus Omnitrophota bacterium]